MPHAQAGFILKNMLLFYGALCGGRLMVPETSRTTWTSSFLTCVCLWLLWQSRDGLGAIARECLPWFLQSAKTCLPQISGFIISLILLLAILTCVCFWLLWALTADIGIKARAFQISFYPSLDTCLQQVSWFLIYFIKILGFLTCECLFLLWASGIDLGIKSRTFQIWSHRIFKTFLQQMSWLLIFCQKIMVSLTYEGFSLLWTSWAALGLIARSVLLWCKRPFKTGLLQQYPLCFLKINVSEGKSISKEAKFRLTNDNECISQFQYFKANFKWTITQLCQQTLPLESCSFGSHNLWGETWKLRLCKPYQQSSTLPANDPFGKCNVDGNATSGDVEKNLYSLCLIHDFWGDKKIGLKHKIYLEAKDLEPLIVVDKCLEYEVLGGLENLIKGPYDFVLPPQTNYAPNDELSVICEISWRKTECKIIKNQSIYHLDACEVDKKWKESFFNLFKNGTNCDVKLKCKDGREISAHKVILGTHSPVFAAMFHHDIVEAEQSVITIEDFDSKIIKSAMGFFYSGYISDTLISLDMFKFADKYGLEGLKACIETKIISLINKDNACEMLLIGHLHNSFPLKETGREYISNNIPQISSRKDFRKFIGDHPDLVVECLVKLS